MRVRREVLSVVDGVVLRGGVMCEVSGDEVWQSQLSSRRSVNRDIDVFTLIESHLVLVSPCMTAISVRFFGVLSLTIAVVWM